MRLRGLACGVAALVAGAFASPASAVLLGFSGVTQNNQTNTNNGQAQLSVEVLSAGGALVDFIFRNVGSVAMAITDIYFDDDALLSYNTGAGAAIFNGPGVLFSQGASPPELPGANGATPPFQTSPGLGFDADPPPAGNGVSPGETVTIRLALLAGNNFASVLADLLSRDLRIGIHVQGFANGGSESFINTNDPPPGTVVPEPGAALLGLIGLTCLHRIRRGA
ncbi:MAG: hypothetical protein AB7Q17_11610 [Phycisphaerae bacterium]